MERSTASTFQQNSDYYYVDEWNGKRLYVRRWRSDIVTAHENKKTFFSVETSGVTICWQR